MTYLLLAVIVVLVLSHFAPDLTRLRRYDWFPSWIAWLAERLAGGPWSSPYALILVLGAPLAAVALLQSALISPLNGVLGLAFAIVALFYAWGPRDLDRDIETVALAAPIEQAATAARCLDGPEPMTRAATVALTGRAAQRRWFGPLFWFVVLGAFGVLLYRLAQLAAEEDLEALPPVQRMAAQRLLAILDWPVAHLMTLGMAVATDFDAVAEAWRRRREAVGGWFQFDPALVPVATIAAVRSDLEADDAYVEAENLERVDLADRASVLREAQTVVWRVLVVWLAIMAVIALASLLGARP